jgi:hypothetical protein
LTPTAEKLRLISRVLGQPPAFVEEEPVEGAYYEHLGMPIMNSDAIGLGELRSWEAFHAGSVVVSRSVGDWLTDSRTQVAGQS